MGLVSAIVSHVCNSCDLTDVKLQPIKVAQAATPSVARMKLVIEELFTLAADPESAIDIVISNVQRGTSHSWPAEAPVANKDCAIVGFLLAFKNVDEVAQNLLGGCQRIELRSIVLEKFIEFLVDEEDSEEEEEDGSVEGWSAQEKRRHAAKLPNTDAASAICVAHAASMPNTDASSAICVAFLPTKCRRARLSLVSKTISHVSCVQ